MTTPKKRSRAAAAQKKKLLLVEDYADAREMYQEYLEFEGYEVETAKDGAEAVQRAQEFLPDLILMDMSLPLVNGWEATRRLKQSERTSAIPVVALTGHALPGHEEKASEVGCEVFLSKPCLPRDVVQSIRTVLKKPKK